MPKNYESDSSRPEHVASSPSVVPASCRPSKLTETVSRSQFIYSYFMSVQYNVMFSVTEFVSGGGMLAWRSRVSFLEMNPAVLMPRN